jgi:hypothetical protein
MPCSYIRAASSCLLALPSVQFRAEDERHRFVEDVAHRPAERDHAVKRGTRLVESACDLIDKRRG